MKLKIKDSKVNSDIKLRDVPESEEFPLRDLNSSHIIRELEENIKLRETPIIERLRNKLKK